MILAFFQEKNERKGAFFMVTLQSFCTLNILALNMKKIIFIKIATPNHIACH